MDAHSFSSQVEALSVTDSGRRRRWSASEKIRIVEESLSRSRSVALTARRHEISRALLTRWRKDYRDGLLNEAPVPSFAPMLIAPEPVEPPVPIAPAPTAPCTDTITITLVNGRQIVVPARIDPAVLARLLPVLDSLTCPPLVPR